MALDVVAAEVACGTGVGQLECLRKVDFLDFQTANFNSSYNTLFTPVVDNITGFSDYAARLRCRDTNFPSWINTFDADVAYIHDDVSLNSCHFSDFGSEALMSGSLYGDARFDCAVYYFLNMRNGKYDTWVYRFFGKYDNVIGVEGMAPTHSTEIPFLLGGNECFDTFSNVTAAR
ncbi:hypothetical protein GGR57DRAFT_498362 [Xylariaceae sp. FL1272]|nr:hypothetical protein GGR57DRAFT_498362 [Xylariaceae sp. FL1272]